MCCTNEKNCPSGEEYASCQGQAALDSPGASPTGAKPVMSGEANWAQKRT